MRYTTKEIVNLSFPVIIFILLLSLFSFAIYSLCAEVQKGNSMVGKEFVFEKDTIEIIDYDPLFQYKLSNGEWQTESFVKYHLNKK